VNQSKSAKTGGQERPLNLSGRPPHLTRRASLAILNHHGHNDQYGVLKMITEINAVAFRQNLGEMINQVQFRHDSIVIKKDGKMVAALVDAKLFERIRQMRERFDALAGRLAQAYAAVPAQEGLAEINRITAKVRSQARSKSIRAKTRQDALRRAKKG